MEHYKMILHSLFLILAPYNLKPYIAWITIKNVFFIMFFFVINISFLSEYVGNINFIDCFLPSYIAWSVIFSLILNYPFIDVSNYDKINPNINNVIKYFLYVLCWEITSGVVLYVAVIAFGYHSELVYNFEINMQAIIHIFLMIFSIMLFSLGFRMLFVSFKKVFSCIAVQLIFCIYLVVSFEIFIIDIIYVNIAEQLQLIVPFFGVLKFVKQAIFQKTNAIDVTLGGSLYLSLFIFFIGCLFFKFKSNE